MIPGKLKTVKECYLIHFGNKVFNLLSEVSTILHHVFIQSNNKLVRKFFLKFFTIILKIWLLHSYEFSLTAGSLEWWRLQTVNALAAHFQSSHSKWRDYASKIKCRCRAVFHDACVAAQCSQRIQVYLGQQRIHLQWLRGIAANNSQVSSARVHPHLLTAPCASYFWH